MLRIKSFPIEKADEASEFMREHTPHTTDKMSGIQINMGHIVIFYDDGEFNYKQLVDKYRNLICKEIEEIEFSKNKILRLKNIIKKTAPKGYKETISDEEFIELCLEEGDTKQKAKDRLQGITQQENDLKTVVGNIIDCQENIKMFEQSAKLYAK